MPDALMVELVAADRMVWSGEATFVIARTVEGDIGVLRGHAPVLSVLSEAIVEITAEDGHTVFAVADGGFLSVAHDRVSILSDAAELADTIDVDAVRRVRDELENILRSGPDDEAEAGLRMADVRLAAAGAPPAAGHH